MKRILALAVFSCLAALNAHAVTKAKAAPAKAAPAAKALPAATPEQLQAAGYVHYGDYNCEFMKSIKVAHNKTDGYVDVAFGKQSFVMKPILSSTGALRMEETNGKGGLLLQIAYKSMLMDEKAGRRLVDGCQHEKQAALQKADEGKPTTSMMDGPAK